MLLFTNYIYIYISFEKFIRVIMVNKIAASINLPYMFTLKLNNTGQSCSHTIEDYYLIAILEQLDRTCCKRKLQPPRI